MRGGIMAIWRALLGQPRAAPVARDPLPDGPIEFQPYVVFDLETTGLRPWRGDAIVQIGAVRLHSGVATQVFNMLVQPGRSIPPVSTRYHGITDDMVAGAPPVAEAVGAFRDFAEGAVLVAHGAAFDLGMLDAAAECHGAPRLPNAALCSMVVARWLDPREEDQSLDGLCGRAGIVIAERHKALGDAEATAALWLRLIARAAARGASDLPTLARMTRMDNRIGEAARRLEA
jgi:DNA polymerase III epsilon subunit family exonuclease